MKNIFRYFINDCFDEDGTCYRCPKCGSLDIDSRIMDTLDGHTVLEEQFFCKNCGEHVCYWAYGHFDSGYMLNHKDKLDKHLYNLVVSLIFTLGIILYIIS